MSDETTAEGMSESVLPDTFGLDVDVTEDDLAKGKPASFNNCPLVLALRLALAAVYPWLGGGVSVWNETAIIWPQGRWGNLRWHAMLPANAKDFLADFDAVPQHGPFKPFSFRLEFTKVVKADG